MTDDLISKKTRNEFREFLVGWTLREIDMEFEAAGLQPDEAYDPPTSGQRRSRVEQYYHSLDFTSPKHVRKLLRAYESILNTALARADAKTWRSPEEVRNAVGVLAQWLANDGYRYENGKIRPVTPVARRAFEEGETSRTISEVTRRNILDELRARGTAWWGRLGETEFLSRIYDLDALPSEDSRFDSARGDIWQHRVNNPDDWSDDWVFGDSRFDLLRGPDETFLRFLCEMVHPVVRPDEEQARELVAVFNQHLASDSWEVVERTRISERPVFGGRRRLAGTSVTVSAAKSVVESLNADYVARQLTRMESAVDTDPELAIGTAKEFVETICKTILAETGKPADDNLDIPALVKRVRGELSLLSEQVPDAAKGAKTIKRLLSNLGTIAQGLAELRSKYGTGHGQHAGTKGLQPRHARLAVSAAAALGVFLFETYQEKKADPGTR